jgi:hypothetical protein
MLAPWAERAWILHAPQPGTSVPLVARETIEWSPCPDEKPSMYDAKIVAR